MTEFNGIEDVKTRESFSPHMVAVIESLKEPLFLKDIYKICRRSGVPDSSVRRILFTFKEEKITIKKDGKWQKT